MLSNPSASSRTEADEAALIAAKMMEALSALDGAVSEHAVALQFAEQNVGRCRFDHERQAWFRWTGARWAEDRTEETFDALRTFAQEVVAGLDEREQRKVSRFNFVKGAERFATTDRRLAVGGDSWDQDPWLLGTPDGTVDLRTGKLRAADPADGVTRLTAIGPALEPECPLWVKFIEQVTKGDEAYGRFLRAWCGYCLTGVTREHALLFAYGQGGRGKGTFLNTVQAIMADYAVTAPIETFTESHNDRHPTELAMLRGARLVTAQETEQGRSWAEARLKMLTGGDVVTARFMRGDFFSFLPSFKLTITGNYRPTLRNVGDAERRRFNLAPFDHKPEPPDLALKEKLQAEWPGILAWMIEGCLDWQAEGLLRPTIVQAATEDYFSGQDVFGSWLELNVELRPLDYEAFVESAVLYKSWKAFAEARGERTGSMKAFSEKLQSRGVLPHRTNYARGFRCIAMRLEDAAPASAGAAADASGSRSGSAGQPIDDPI